MRYLFLLESESTLDAHPELLLLLLAALLAVLTLCFFAVRRILSPLKEIEKGVSDVALGHLDTTVAIRSRDELGRLAKQFNSMLERVRNMMSAKEQLLLDVSHEFRSPLTRIRVALEIPGEQARASIVRAIKDLEAMLAELLESARLGDVQGRLKLEEINIAETLRDLAQLFEDQKPGIRLGFSETTLLCFADPARFQIALRNLVENAMKYSSHQAQPVEIGLQRSTHNTVRMTIRDHGMGMASDELEFIFEPFYRVDRSRVKATGGYGLGLALSKKIIEAHLGSIRVESALGAGATFIIELPCESQGAL
jgi:signal transduction histidine kinase